MLNASILFSVTEITFCCSFLLPLGLKPVVIRHQGGWIVLCLKAEIRSFYVQDTAGREGLHLWLQDLNTITQHCPVSHYNVLSKVMTLMDLTPQNGRHRQNGAESHAVMEKPDTSLQPTPRKKSCVFSLVLHMVFDVPTHSRRSERHRLTSGQHRTQWSMFKLLLSLSHTHTMTHRHIQTHNAYKSCRTEHSVPKEWFIVKPWKLPKQLQSGCSTRQWEMVKYVPFSRSLLTFSSL